MNASTTPQNKALAEAASRVKPDLETLVLKWGEDKYNQGYQRAVDDRSRNRAYDDLGHDAPDFEPVSDRIEQAGIAEYERDLLITALKAVLADVS